jgi:hypothetical protein
MQDEGSQSNEYCQESSGSSMEGAQRQSGTEDGTDRLLACFFCLCSALLSTENVVQANDGCALAALDGYKHFVML